jgi:glycine hydroxymethyltransferase
MLIILLKIILQIYYNLTVSQRFLYFCCKLTKNNEMQRDKQIFDLILEEQERQIHGLELLLQRISQVMRSWKQLDLF